MRSGGYEYQSEFARKYVAQGLAQGRAEARAHDVLAVLEARRIEVPESVRQQVLGCADSEVLDRWLRRAAVANAVSELFEERAS